MSKEIPPKSIAFPEVTKWTNDPIEFPKHERHNKMLFGRHVLIRNINDEKVLLEDFISGQKGIHPRSEGIKIACKLRDKYKKLRVIPIHYNKDGEFLEETLQ